MRFFMLVLISLLWCVDGRTQEQFFKPLNPSQRQMVNPGFVAAHRGPVLGMTHMYQVYDGLRTFNTTVMNFSNRERYLNGSYGVGLLYDNEAGDNQSFKLEGRYAYKLILSRRTSMAFGIEASFRNRKQRMDRLYDRFHLEQGPAMVQYDIVRSNTVNTGAGILFWGPGGYFGLSMSDLLPTNYLDQGIFTIEDQPVYSMQTGVNFNVGGGSSDSTSGGGVDIYLDMFYQGQPEMKMKLGNGEFPFRESLQRGGVMFTAKYRGIYAGIGYAHWVERMNEATFHLGYELTNNWNVSYVLGYGKVYSLDNHAKNANIFNQVSLTWLIPTKPPMRQFMGIGTPSF